MDEVEEADCDNLWAGIGISLSTFLALWSEARFVDEERALLGGGTAASSMEALCEFQGPVVPELGLARERDGDLECSSGLTVARDERELADW